MLLLMLIHLIHLITLAPKVYFQSSKAGLLTQEAAKNELGSVRVRATEADAGNHLYLLSPCSQFTFPVDRSPVQKSVSFA